MQVNRYNTAMSSIKSAGALLLFIALGLWGPMHAEAQSDTCVSNGNGTAWADANNWDNCNSDGPGYPDQGDAAVINTGDLVILNTSGITIDSLRAESGETTQGGSDTELFLNQPLSVDGSGNDNSGGVIIGVDDEDSGDATVDSRDEGNGAGELRVSGSFRVINAGLYRTDTGNDEGLLLTGGNQTIELSGLNSSISRLETNPGVTLNLATRVDVDDLIADGSPQSSGLTVNSGNSSRITILGNSSNTSISGDLTLNGGASGDFSESFTVPGDLTVGGGGTLTLNANVPVSGNLTTNGSGTTIDLSGVDQVVSGQLDINDGSTYNISGDSLTVNSFGTVNGELSLGSGGFDMNADFLVESSGTLNLGNGQMDIAGDLTNNNNLATNANALVVFDDPSPSGQNVSGSSGYSGSNSFQHVKVVEGTTVDPADKFSDSGSANPIDVSGQLLVVDEGGQSDGAGQWGSGSSEGAGMTYKGFDFRVQNDETGEKGEFFAEKIVFNNTNADTDNTVTANGAVFSVFELTAGFVEVTRELEVNDLFRIGTGTVSLDGGELVVNDDFTNNDTYLPGTGITTFSGQTNTSPDDPSSSSCGGIKTADGDCEQDLSSSGTLGFGPFQVDGTDTRVNITDDIDINGGGLIVDPGGDDDNVQFRLDPNEIVDLNVTGDITINGGFTSGGGIVTLDGGSPQTITTSPNLRLETLDLNNGSNVELVDARITVTDSLSVQNGKALVGTGDTLRVGGPARLASGDGEVSIEQSGDGQFVLLSDDSKDFEGRIEYVDSEPNGTLNGTISGTVTFERNLTGGSNYYYLSAPVSSNPDAGNATFEGFLEGNPTLLAGDQTNDLQTKGPDGSDNPGFNGTSVRLYKEPDVGAGEESIQGWKTIDCAGFDGYSGCSSGLTDPMKSGRGYAVYVYNQDEGSPATGSFPKTIYSQVEPRSNTTFQFSASDGSPSDGPGLDVSDDDNNGVDEEEGWNLLGNPYLTSIDFCAAKAGDTDVSGMTKGSNIGSTVYVWDPLNGDDGTSTDGYGSFNCATDSPGGVGNQGLPEGYIAPHQAFFVKGEAESSGLELTIENIAEAQADTAEVFLKQATEKPPALALTLESDGLAYTTSVGFVKGKSKTLDNADGYYNGGAPAKSGISFYSLLPDGTGTVINAMPRTLNEEATLPLKVDGCNQGTPLQGTVSIRRSMMRNLPGEWGVTLQDTKTGKTVNLKENADYTFDYSGTCTTKSKSKSGAEASGPPMGTVTHSTAKSSSPNTRFQLVIDPDANPNAGDSDDESGDDSDDESGDDSSDDSGSDDATIEFGDFTIDGVDASTAKLSVPASGSVSIELQHKFRAATFETVASVSSAKATTNSKAYTATGSTITIDKSKLEAGTHKYRLKAGDKTSKVERLNVKGTTLTTYPNPAGPGEQATVEFVTEQATDVTVSLYNTLGQRIRVLHRGTVDAGESIRTPIDAQSLSSGVYFVRMRGDGVRATTRMTIVK
jgi:hypothetical protein